MAVEKLNKETVTAAGRFLVQQINVGAEYTFICSGTPDGATVEVQISNDGASWISDAVVDNPAYFPGGTGTVTATVGGGEYVSFNVVGGGGSVDLVVSMGVARLS